VALVTGASKGIGAGIAKGLAAAGASLGWSDVCRAARPTTFGSFGWFWFLSADDSGWKAIPLVAVLALAALVGIMWYASRARADRQWRAALDRYAEQEEAKQIHARRVHR
jgi:NAD(P)-dependent dehydrogenase (short-subunit alcohol dehydrogenase family)